MNINQIAQQILSTHYANRPVPVVITSVANSMGFSTKNILSKDSKSVWSNTSIIGYGSNLKQQKFALAYGLAQIILYRNYGEHTMDQWINSYDPKIVAAKRLAEELLVPSYPLKIVVEDQGCTSVAQMANTFDVSEDLVVQRLKRQRYIR